MNPMLLTWIETLMLVLTGGLVAEVLALRPAGQPAGSGLAVGTAVRRIRSAQGPGRAWAGRGAGPGAGGRGSSAESVLL